MWLPALCWIVPPLVWALYASRWAAVTTAISLVIWVVVYWAEGAPVRYALLYPLGAAMVAGIMLRSAWRGAQGGGGGGGLPGGGTNTHHHSHAHAACGE